MKKIILLSATVFMLCSAFIISETKISKAKRLEISKSNNPAFGGTDDGDKIPSVTLKKLDGSKVNSSTFSNNGKPIIISFWATWCVPCKKELDAIAKKYTDWEKETGVKLIAVSIDNEKSFSKVVESVKTKGWPFEVYIDDKEDFKNAMKVGNVPYTFLVDGTGKIVWSHNSYTAGDEDKLYENVQSLVKGEKLKH